MLFEELKNKRDILYEQFDAVKSPKDIYELQFSLAEAIIESEKKIKSGNETEEWSFHLDRLYGIGDAIAWSVIDSFTIRQLGKYEAIRTSLLGQEGDYLELMRQYVEETEKSFLIFSDLTRCITIGDIIEVKSPDNVNIIECKKSGPSMITATNLLSGRTGRQFSKSLWLTRFLRTGFEKLYGHAKPSITLEIDMDCTFHFKLLPQLIRECLEQGFAIIQAEPGLIYLAKDLNYGEKNDTKSNAEIRSNLHSFKTPILAGTGRLIEEDTETAYHCPALNFPLDLASRKLLQEVDINIIGILDTGYLNELAEKKGYCLTLREHCYPVLKKGETEYQFNVRFINDILINFTSAESAVDVLIALYEAVESRKDKFQTQAADLMQDRPSNGKEMIAFLEKEYVVARLDGEGNFVEAHRMTGEKIL